MDFHKIDIGDWNRAAAYRHYMVDSPCTYSMCVNLDVSKILPMAKAKNLKLFPICLYGLSCIVNHHSEFRMGFDEQGDLGYYNVLNPSYTVFHEATETITNLWTEYNVDFRDFHRSYLDDLNDYGDKYIWRAKPVSSDNIFYVSCIPWTSFTGFHLDLKKGYDNFSPVFTIGKYFEENGKILLPIAIQVHHAVCDGFHVARFINELQEWCDSFIL